MRHHRPATDGPAALDIDCPRCGRPAGWYCGTVVAPSPTAGNDHLVVCWDRIIARSTRTQPTGDPPMKRYAPKVAGVNAVQIPDLSDRAAVADLVSDLMRAGVITGGSPRGKGFYLAFVGRGGKTIPSGNWVVVDDDGKVSDVTDEKFGERYQLAPDDQQGLDPHPAAGSEQAQAKAAAEG